MRTSPLLLGLAAIGLLGAGAWVGRTSSAPPSMPAASAAPARSARIEHAAAPVPRAPTQARMPALRGQGGSTTPGLSADLIDADPKVRRAALREVARDPEVDPALVLGAARDHDLEVGVIATHALGKLYVDGKVSTRDLIAVASDRGLNDRVRINALGSLALAPAPEAVALLVDLLASGSTLERSTAALLLVHQDPELAMPALIRALADADEHVRSNALEALRSRARGRDFGTDAGAWSAWWQARPR